MLFDEPLIVRPGGGQRYMMTRHGSGSGSAFAAGLITGAVAAPVVASTYPRAYYGNPYGCDPRFQYCGPYAHSPYYLGGCAGYPKSNWVAPPARNAGGFEIVDSVVGGGARKRRKPKRAPRRKTNKKKK